jgi:hypothetical protein
MMEPRTLLLENYLLSIFLPDSKEMHHSGAYHLRYLCAKRVPLLRSKDIAAKWKEVVGQLCLG